MFEIPVSISSICVNSIIIKVGPYLTVSDRISGEISPLRLGFELVRLDLFQFFCCCPPAVCVCGTHSYLTLSLQTRSKGEMTSCFIPFNVSFRFVFSSQFIECCYLKCVEIPSYCEDITVNVQKPSLL